MVKMMAAMCRKPGMTHAERVAHVQHVHGAISNEQPLVLRRYMQNHVFDAAFGSGSEAVHAPTVARDLITELWWDGPAAMGETLAHEHLRARVGPDAANFADASRTLSLVALEAEQALPHPGRAAGAMVLHCLRAAPALPLPEFFERWACAHERALLAVNAEAGAAFHDPAQSFFVYATEVPIDERVAH